MFIFCPPCFPPYSVRFHHLFPRVAPCSPLLIPSFVLTYSTMFPVFQSVFPWFSSWFPLFPSCCPICFTIVHHVSHRFYQFSYPFHHFSIVFSMFPWFSHSFHHFPMLNLALSRLFPWHRGAPAGCASPGGGPPRRPPGWLRRRCRRAGWRPPIGIWIAPDRGGGREGGGGRISFGPNY